MPKDIDAAAAPSSQPAKRGRIHVFLATSKIHREFKLNKAQEEILRLAVEGVRRAKTFVDNVEFSPEDASRTEPDFLVRSLPGGRQGRRDHGQHSRYRGLGRAGRIRRFINIFTTRCRNLKAAGPSSASIATTTSAWAWPIPSPPLRRGARQVECTLNGIGERAGNAAMEEIVMALKTRKDFYGKFECGVNTREIVKASRLVSRMSGLVVQRSKAIVGENAFAHSSGIHQDGILKKRETYEIMDPEAVGWGGTELPLTKHSGRARRRRAPQSTRFQDGATPTFAAIFARFKEIGDKKKFVYDDDLCALVEGQITEGPETWTLEYLNVTSGNQAVPTATVRLQKFAGKKGITVQDAGIGDGPVDAALKAIDRLTDTRAACSDYSLRAVSQGKDALGEVTVKVDFGKDKIVTGKGASTDVIEASARAYLNAVNRSLAEALSFRIP